MTETSGPGPLHSRSVTRPFVVKSAVRFVGGKTMLGVRPVPLLFWVPLVLGAGGDGGSSSDARERRDEDPGSLETDVLVVDDEPDAVDSIVELLESEGYRAAGARNGQDALSRLQRGLRPALILLDLKMPVMDGWDFCAALGNEERFADIPIAIVTASASLHSLPARRNDAGFFLKPIDFDRLLRVVRDVCG